LPEKFALEFGRQETAEFEPTILYGFYREWNKIRSWFCINDTMPKMSSAKHFFTSNDTVYAIVRDEWVTTCFSI
jgi:hypothetical protein